MCLLGIIGRLSGGIMIKTVLIPMTILATILFKFNSYFANSINEHNWVLIYGYVVITLALIIYGFIYEIFSSTGPLGKFVYHFLITLTVVSFILIPFNNITEFFICFSIAACVMIAPIYCIIKKVQQLNESNYSIVAMLNEKITLISKNNLLIAWVIVGFVFSVSLSNNAFNYIALGVFIYFSLLVAVSLYTKFTLMKNVSTDVVTLFVLASYSLSFLGYQIPDMGYTLAALSYVLITLYDVVAMVRYIKDPEMFLKHWEGNKLAIYILRKNPAATIDYFKYFKNIKVGEPFIVYDALLGNLKYIITDQYYIRKQFNDSSDPSDKLFHVVEKEIQHGRFNDFINVSQKRLDEHTNLDKYAMFNFGIIQNYMRANHMEYNELTDDDLKVIEMYQY